MWMVVFGTLVLAAGTDGRVHAPYTSANHFIPLCDHSADDPMEAIKACDAGLADKAATPRQLATLLSLRGNAELELHHTRDARAGYDASIRTDPSYDYAYANRGFLELLQNEDTLALADCDKSLALQPDNYWALYCRGIARLRAGLIVDGNNDINKVLKDDGPGIAKGYAAQGINP